MRAKCTEICLQTVLQTPQQKWGENAGFSRVSCMFCFRERESTFLCCRQKTCALLSALLQDSLHPTLQYSLRDALQSLLCFSLSESKACRTHRVRLTLRGVFGRMPTCVNRRTKTYSDFAYLLIAGKNPIFGPLACFANTRIALIISMLQDISWVAFKFILTRLARSTVTSCISTHGDKRNSHVNLAAYAARVAAFSTLGASVPVADDNKNKEFV
jgi:hypothetical protein